MEPTKRERQLMELDAELAGLIGAGKRTNRESYLAAALDIATRGTRLQYEATEIIKQCCPQYFEEKNDD